MGNYLSMPCTKKLCKMGSNRRLVFGLAEMQGWRETMEDKHTAVLDLDGRRPGEHSNAFFAVYDGHYGSSVAEYAAQNLHKRLVTEQSYKKQYWKTALKDAFLGTDKDIEATPLDKKTGSCAIAALLTKDRIYVANAGDSRSVLSVKGKAKPLSIDHKPTNGLEKARISKAGGNVQVGRVNGDLALSRALGDFSFKKRSDLSPEEQAITADPDVMSRKITKQDEFLVMACDGIWDCLSSQAVVDFVRYQVSEGKELTEICEMIFEHCLAPDTSGKGCDNMTLLIVGITHCRTKEEWYKWIKERVRNKYGYKTPSIPPKIYDEHSLASFRVKRDTHEAKKVVEAMPKNETPE